MSAIIGLIPGVVDGADVAVQGNYAYIASRQFGLSIADVSIPGLPQAVGVADIPFFGDRIAVAGNKCLVACAASGLKLLDVSDRTAPLVIGSIRTVVRQVAMTETIGYAIFTIPGNPARTGLFTLDLVNYSPFIGLQGLLIPTTFAVRYHNNRIYLVTTTNIQVIDVANPLVLKVLANIPTRTNNPKDVALFDSGGHTYMIVADTDNVSIFDVTNLSNVQVKGYVDAGVARRIAYSNGVAHVLDGNNFLSIDMSDVTAPVLKATEDNLLAQGLDATSENLYLAAPGGGSIPNRHGGLYEFRIESLENPILEGELFGEFDDFGIGVNTAQNLAAVAGNNFGLSLIDITDPTAPTQTALITSPLVSSQATFKGVCLDDNRIYAIMTSPGNPAKVELVVFTLTGSSVALTGRCTLSGAPREIKTLGTGFVAVAAGNRLLIVDVTTASAPAVIGNLAMTALSVSLTTNKAFVAGDTNLYSVNTTTLATPTLAGTLALVGSTTCHLGSGNKLYVIGNNQLKTVDVTTYTAMVLRSTVNSFGAQGVTSIGNKVFLATPSLNHGDTSGGVRTYDTTTATAPVFGERVIVPSKCRCLANNGTNVFAGDGASQLTVISG